jgi:hypothetical protein
MRRIADLVGHPVSVALTCGCTRLLVVQPGWLLSKLGPDATIEEGERRLICRTCRQRALLRAKGDWGVSGGRDNRREPAPFPDWVDLS